MTSHRTNTEAISQAPDHSGTFMSIPKPALHAVPTLNAILPTQVTPNQNMGHGNDDKEIRKQSTPYF
ncbi:hypothetical protein BOTNAR_0173g00120 [Botryotinia narcissicola]|uniref:Uncharacterized protein n=1 Tax=Botryotinia narcissicola TaxID=278944 RepID=A0A4Z1IQ78_9HELO|nr:hypothetical protein BOTNAR_0173g00120 [Botryotinia narcissicola]